MAYTAMGTGVGWLVLLIGAVAAQLIMLVLGENANGRGTSDIAAFVLGSVAVTALLAIPGLAFIYYGRKLLKYPTFKRIRDAIGSLALIVALLIYAGTETLVMRFGVNNGQFAPPVAFGTILIVLPLFAVVCRQVLVHDDIAPRSYRVIVTKRLLFWCAVLMYFSLSGVVDPLAWATWGLSGSPWSMVVGFLGPLLFAYCFYQITIRVLGHVPRVVKDDAESKSFRLDRSGRR